MKYKISAMIAVSLCISSVRAFISIPIPATEGSRQILVNEITSQVNALETKLDIIDTNVDNIESSVGVGLSTKVDRINNNMKIPITVAGTISTGGSYILANDITGTITVSASNVTIDFNQYKLIGQLRLSGILTKLDFYNGTIESSSGACFTIVAGAGQSSADVTLDGLVLRQKDTTSSAIALLPSSFGEDYWIRNCIIIGSSKTATTHYGIHYAFGDPDGRITVENCIIGNFYRGIEVDTTAPASMTIQNCQVTDCGHYGIHLDSSTHQYTVVRHNLLKDNGRGIFLGTFFDYCLIFGNVITGCTDGAGYAIQNNSGLTANQIYGNFAYNNAGTNYFSVNAIETTVTGTLGIYANISL